MSVAAALIPVVNIGCTKRSTPERNAALRAADDNGAISPPKKTTLNFESLPSPFEINKELYLISPQFMILLVVAVAARVTYAADFGRILVKGDGLPANPGSLHAVGDEWQRRFV